MRDIYHTLSGGDRFADLVERDSELILHGLQRDIQHFGHFAVFQAVLFHQLEDRPAFGRQLIDGPLDKNQHIGADHQLFGVQVYAGKCGGELDDRGGWRQ